MHMESLSKLLIALASLAWPAIFALILLKFADPLKKLIESAHSRKFTIKVAGNELTMEEASEQQRRILDDIQSKLAELEKRLTKNDAAPLRVTNSLTPSTKRILWVDDQPKNNSFLVALLEDRGVKVDVALSTNEGIEKFKSHSYDMIISDMGRPEGGKAGIDLALKIRSVDLQVPFFIFCGNWAARNLHQESLQAGVNEITSSGTTLLSLLPLSNGN